MNNDCQTEIPRSFIELFMPPGSVKPNQGRSVIAARYEFCEDMAQMLVDQAATLQFKTGRSEAEVLQTIEAGLTGGDAGIRGGEAGWVVTRMAELLGWTVG